MKPLKKMVEKTKNKDLSKSEIEKTFKKTRITNKTNSNKPVISGLVNRRWDEAEMFYNGDYKRNH